MDHEVRVAAVERELGEIVAAVAATPPDARVPTCPDFTLDDLVEHVGTFCGFWTHVLCEGTGREKTPFDAIDPTDRAAWLDAIAGHLVGELRATPPATTVWTWFPPDQSAAFVARRCSHELAIHRVDAQLAGGAADPVDAELAADGIEEIFVLMTLDQPDAARDAARSGQRLHLHGTDHAPAEWLLTFEPGGVRVDREHAKGDLALRGPVSDLEMLLYQRPTVGAVERLGDPSVLDTFHRWFTF